MNGSRWSNRSDRLAGRWRQPVALALHAERDPVTVAVWITAVLVTPAVVVLTLGRGRRLAWPVPLVAAIAAVASALIGGEPWWVLVAPIGGELAVLARIVGGRWPLWTGSAFALWAVAGVVVGVGLVSFRGWHRERFAPAYDRRAEVTDEQLDAAVLAARWAPLDPARLTIGVDIDTLEPVAVTRDDVRRHGLLLGESGTGKTILIVQLLDWFVIDGIRP